MRKKYIKLEEINIKIQEYKSRSENEIKMKIK